MNRRKSEPTKNSKFELREAVSDSSTFNMQAYKSVWVSYLFFMFAVVVVAVF